MADRGDRLIETTGSASMMGGDVTIMLAHDRSRIGFAHRDIAGLLQRIGAWAARLTRFDPDSELSRLNADPRARRCPVGPTLSAVLAAAHRLGRLSAGSLDVGMLGARLAAEHHDGHQPEPGRGRWWLERRGRGGVVCREGVVSFDLDGIAKGWMADRALRCLDGYPAALVDMDGDIAMRDALGVGWQVAVADPHREQHDVAVLVFGTRTPGKVIGVATSGTTRHRWSGPGTPRHHLIDPATGRPAQGDIVQATVVASSAAEAEALAKAAVIRPPVESAAVLAKQHSGALLVDSAGAVWISGPRATMLAS